MGDSSIILTHRYISRPKNNLSIMADEENTPVEVEQEEQAGYQPPPEKSIDEMLKTDEDDEALQKYKASLLGDGVSGSGAVVVDPSDPRKVILKMMQRGTYQVKSLFTDDDK